MVEIHEENYQRFEEQQDELRDQRLNMAEQFQQLSILTQTINQMAQNGSQHPQTGSGPSFCISGSSVSGAFPTTGRQDLGANNTHASARSVKRSAPPQIYRGVRRK